MKTYREKFLEWAERYADAKEYVFEKNDTNPVLRKKNELVANNMVKKIKNLYFKEQSEVNLKQINDLMRHKNKYVRLLAATYSLETSSELAQNTLEDLTCLPGIIGFDAKLSLDIWKRGYLKK